jgi:hypothetical protein
MSKKNDDQPVLDQTDPNSAGETITADNPDLGGSDLPPDKPGDLTPGNLTIEEHAKNLKIDAPVFAAVMQINKWASGKKVSEADFKKAAKDFLGAPMGGQ